MGASCESFESCCALRCGKAARGASSQLTRAATAARSFAGHITVGARERTDDAMIEVWVTDSGCGVPEENLAKIFEPFAQVGRFSMRMGF